MRARMLRERSVRCRRTSGSQIDRSTDQGAEAEVTPRAVKTPSGPVAAAEAFAWMNRQLSWQSTLADLEAKAGVSGTRDPLITPGIDRIALTVPNLDEQVDRLTSAFGMVVEGRSEFFAPYRRPRVGSEDRAEPLRRLGGSLPALRVPCRRCRRRAREPGQGRHGIP